MKPIPIIGILLILAGIAAFVLGEVSFTRKETVLQIGDAKIEAESKDTLPLPPIAAGAAVVAGLVLVFIGYRRR